MAHNPETVRADIRTVRNQTGSVLSVKKIQQLGAKPTTRFLESDVRLKKDIETA